jgi:hypothetical protein
VRINLDDQNITIAGHRFAYGIYYFDSDEFAGLRPSEVMLKILEEWRRALIENTGDGRTFFLPFELDDEWVECIMATSEDNTLKLRHVWANENGYSVPTDDLVSFIVAPHEIRRDLGELGQYSRQELILALSNPEIAPIS